MFATDAGDLPIALGRVSAQAAVLVLVVLAVQWLFRKQLPPRWRAALWWLVAARLVLPVSFDSGASLFNFVPGLGDKPAVPKTSAVPAAIPPVTPPAIELEAEGATAIAVPEIAASPVEPPLRTELPPFPGTDAGSAMQTPPGSVEAPPIRWSTIAFAIWLTGAVFVSGHVLVGSLRLSHRLRRRRRVTDESALAVLESCREQMRVAWRVQMFECAGLQSPALFGFLRPKLLLPAGFTHRFSPTELRFIFLHELAHVRRRDLPVNWLLALLQVVHWFNPLLWLGFNRWRADRELACDALALEAAGSGQNQEYGRTILRLLESMTRHRFAPGLVGILEDKRQLHRRIRMIATYVPNRRWSVFAALLLLVLAAVSLTDAKSESLANSNTPAPAETNAAPARVQTFIGTDSGPSEFPTRDLVVTVVDRSTGQPISGAEVHAPYLPVKPPIPRRLTDASGRFVLKIPQPPKEHSSRISNFGLSAEHAGYAPRAVMWTSAAGDVHSSVPEAVTIRLEKGIRIGGTVRDEEGKPVEGARVLISGSGYKGFNLGNSQRLTHDYGQFHRTDANRPAATTDAAGRWSVADFPEDVSQLEITFVRPDGARETFGTESEIRANDRPLISLEELRNQSLAVNLAGGFSVRGIVVDETGKPLEGVTVHEGYGFGNIVRVAEFKTGPDGRFQLVNRAEREWIYTATRTDRAIVSTVVKVGPELKDVRIVMPSSLKPVTIRVEDETGKPLPDVEFGIDPYHTYGQILDWTGKTDSTGTVTWTNAPRERVVLTARGQMRHRKLALKPEDTHRVLVLKPGTLQQAVVTVKARDAVSGAPVKVRSVTRSYTGDSNFKSAGEPNRDEFPVVLKMEDVRVGMYPSAQLRLEADGYETFTSPHLDMEEGDQEFIAELVPGIAPSGIALLPDGSPAAGARVWIQVTANSSSLFINGPGRYYGDHLQKEQVGKDGSYRLQNAASSSPVVFTHADGLLATTIGELRTNHSPKLQKWGAIRGRALVAGKPASGIRVQLNTRNWSPASGVHLSYGGVSGEDGTFSFTNIPPGEYKLYRWLSKRRFGTITETYQMPVDVRPGETTEIDYGFAGRAIVGQAQSSEPGQQVDWMNDDHLLVSKSIEHPIPKHEDFATTASFQKALQTYHSRRTMPPPTFQLEFQEDGSFRAEDVKPGKYELRLRVTKPLPNNPNHFDRGEEVGSLIREVIIPAGKEPLDLGTLTVNMRSAAGPKLPPVEMNAETFDGQPASLAHFQGKRVLIVFWASWSERSLETLEALRKPREEFGTQNQIAWVAINLDEDRDSGRAAIVENGFQQLWLKSGERAKLTAALNIDTLPNLVLLDSEHRVTGRDMSVTRATESLRRIFAKADPVKGAAK